MKRRITASIDVYAPLDEICERFRYQLVDSQLSYGSMIEMMFSPDDFEYFEDIYVRYDTQSHELSFKISTSAYRSLDADEYKQYASAVQSMGQFMDAIKQFDFTSLDHLDADDIRR